MKFLASFKSISRDFSHPPLLAPAGKASIFSFLVLPPFSRLLLVVVVCHDVIVVVVVVDVVVVVVVVVVSAVD